MYIQRATCSRLATSICFCFCSLIYPLSCFVFLPAKACLSELSKVCSSVAHLFFFLSRYKFAERAVCSSSTPMRTRATVRDRGRSRDRIRPLPTASRVEKCSEETEIGDKWPERARGESGDFLPSSRQVAIASARYQSLIDDKDLDVGDLAVAAIAFIPN